MKKRIVFFVILITAAFALVGCADNDDTMVISERFFANEMLDLVINHQQYLDRTVQFEGMFRHLEPVDGQERYMVMRYFMDCCEVLPLGLRVFLDDMEPFGEDAWVEVVGTLVLEEGTLALRLTSIFEMEEQGAWIVMS